MLPSELDMNQHHVSRIRQLMRHVKETFFEWQSAGRAVIVQIHYYYSLNWLEGMLETLRY